MSSGRSPPTIGARLDTLADFDSSIAGTSTVSCVPAAACSSMSMEPERHEITAVSVVAWACTVNAPPKIEWVAAPSPSMSTTSLSQPELVRTARRPATSRPSAPAGMSTALGETRSTSTARASTCGVDR